MNSKKSSLAGFIDGLQASNIASNSSVLKVSTDYLYMQVKDIENESINDTIKEIRNLLEKDYNLHVVDLYIKLGEELKILLASDVKIKNRKEIASQYLSIAKILMDKRVDDAAVAIAKIAVQ